MALFRYASGEAQGLTGATGRAAQAAQVAPGRAYLGWMTPEGEIGIVEASPQLPGHTAAVAQGVIPAGSRGFSFVISQEGQMFFTPESALNMDLPGYALPNNVLDAVKAGLKTAH